MNRPMIRNICFEISITWKREGRQGGLPSSEDCFSSKHFSNIEISKLSRKKYLDDLNQIFHYRSLL